MERKIIRREGYGRMYSIRYEGQLAYDGRKAQLSTRGGHTEKKRKETKIEADKLVKARS